MTGSLPWTRTSRLQPGAPAESTGLHALLIRAGGAPLHTPLGQLSSRCRRPQAASLRVHAVLLPTPAHGVRMDAPISNQCSNASQGPNRCLQNLSGYHIHDRDPFWERMMHTSVFHLCPRGNGPSSYRLYEALQADTIPIYIWDEVGPI